MYRQISATMAIRDNSASVARVDSKITCQRSGLNTALPLALTELAKGWFAAPTVSGCVGTVGGRSSSSPSEPRPHGLTKHNLCQSLGAPRRRL
jgi:hypothetical protein